MSKKNILQLATERVVIFDGALGTQLQQRGLPAGMAPEQFNFLHPEILSEVFREYAQAGADVITANTFGANRMKLAGSGYTVIEIVNKAVEIAKNAAGEDKYVALDMGPTGAMIEPFGTLTWDEAYDIYKEQAIAGETAGADIIIIETMSDLAEARAAVLAAKENTSLPVFCTMSFQENARTFMGASAASAAISLGALADAVGVNCSLGPKELVGIVREMAEYTDKPIIVQPNAGLPICVDGETVYNIKSDEFASYVPEFIAAGASFLGGCCGTSPEYIRKIKSAAKALPPIKRERVRGCTVCSASKVISVDGVKVIGERINPTGKKLFKEALLKGDIDYILRQGTEQADAGADILDVNVGMPGIDEVLMMKCVVRELQSIVSLPFQIDSSDPAVIEGALRLFNGKAIVNSVNGTEKSLETILPLIKKYGSCAVALCLDDKGIPETAEERVAIAEKIIKRAAEYGIPAEDIIVDCLTLTVGAQQEQAARTLSAIRTVKEKFGVKTVLGVSNISFGLPRRDIINETFLAGALAAGLDLPIINPNAEGMMNIVRAHRVLSATDESAKDYVSFYAETKEAVKPVQSASPENVNSMNLSEIIIKGFKNEAAAAAQKLLGEKAGLDIVSQDIIPALEIVGERYEKGIIFLPQLIQSAETVQCAVEEIKKSLGAEGGGISRGRIVLATVKGDIHDIGKNIVKIILENYGYDVIDLGRDVSPEAVVNAAVAGNVKLVGLSALMTTTVKNMEETIKLLHEKCPETKIMVGGAVLTSDYAAEIGADYYAKDANQSVNAARDVFGK